MLRKALLIVGIIISHSAFPIGRIGNNQSIGDPKERYSATVPERFASISAVDDGGVLLSSGLTTVDPMLPIEIQMRPFRTEFPKLKGASEIEAFFLKVHGMEYRKLTIANGALNMMGESESTFVGFSVCGDGRGYIMFATKAEFIQQGMLDLMTRTVFEVPCPR